MRLSRLSIHRFQCIESADVEFGPGLNVLYGPNDLGKSSLAWAIRAVLLLQHNSAHHTRFVSWYGGGEPRVSLTFLDADGRYWRVTKTFGSSAGRSALEASKDGCTFSAEASGRQVDEKLRGLLGWGVPAPATGGARGFPDSFLAQVLLSEQDNVRKVLFDTSLTTDGDESGRNRLTEALGTLAQDPMFKKVLDDAQTNVDRAFTAKGRKKTAAGSPFIEIAGRIKTMQAEHDELEAKVRNTIAAEARIRELIELRDVTSRELEEARRVFSQYQARLVVAKRRRALQAQIEEHRAKLQTGETLQRGIEQEQAAVDDLQKKAALGATHQEELTALAAQQGAAKDAARQKLDTITLDDGASDRRHRELQEQLGATREQLQDAERGLDRATEAKRAAKAAADSFATATAAVAPLAAASRVADAASVAATARETRAKDELERARERFRDATSGDKAQARVLRRNEVENSRLKRAADRTGIVALLGQVSETKTAIERAKVAKAACDGISNELASARAAVASSQEALGNLDAGGDSLQLLLGFGRLGAARTEAAAAGDALDRASQARGQAESLRAEEARLRATLRDNLPTSAQVGELRRLHDDLRVAEASLGGGMSITIWPRRELTLSASRDGIPDGPLTTRDPITVSANRVLSLSIDELVDVEITAGEEGARTKATLLRARWSAEGATVLEAQGVETVEALEGMLAEAERTRRAADDLHRDADAADQWALQRANPAELEALAARIAELERSLGAADPAASARELDELGAGWEAALQRRIASTLAERGLCLTKLDEERQRVARCEARLESEASSAAALQQQADHQQTALGEAPAALEARAQNELAGVDHELAEIEAQLVVLAGAATADSTARAAVDTAEKALAVAGDDRGLKAAAAQQARDALVQAEARSDVARTQARELDHDGRWSAALEAGAPLSLDRWNELWAHAEERTATLKRSCAELQGKLDDLVSERTLAIETARDALRAAEALAAASQTAATDITTQNRQLQSDVNMKQLAVADMKTRLAGEHLELTRTTVSELQTELAALGGDIEIDERDVEDKELKEKRLEIRLREAEDELARARGALEQVGGAIVRERQRELSMAIDHERRREHETEVEYEAWKLLVETMRESESTEGAHLGRALAGPVSQRFRELTGGRYGALELGAHLDAGKLQVGGEGREISALSAGTQDQLATLLRLCVAEQLRTGIVLDDHLSQSDPTRVGWFNSVLRAAAHQIQIVFITCRPLEVLSATEMPAGPEEMKPSAAGQLRAIDLTRVIRRFAPGTIDPLA